MVLLSKNPRQRRYSINIHCTGLFHCLLYHQFGFKTYLYFRISYCADDKAEKRFFSFIAKEADSEKHTCFVFVSDKLAEEITLTIGQAFDLAYKRFLSGKTQESDKEKIARLERENAELSQRLKDVGNLVEPSKLSEYLRKNNVRSANLFINILTNLLLY